MQIAPASPIIIDCLWKNIPHEESARVPSQRRMILSAGVSASIVNRAGPGTAEFYAAITEIQSRIAATDAQTAKYSGGRILIEIQLRLADWRAIHRASPAAFEEQGKR
jgi:hypothetical protein